MINHKTNPLCTLLHLSIPVMTLIALATPQVGAAYPIASIPPSTDAPHDIQQLRTAARQTPDNRNIKNSEEYRKLYLTLLATQDRLKEANYRRIMLLRQSIQDNPKEIAPAMELASFYVQSASLDQDADSRKDNYEKAVESYDTVLKRQPDNGRALRERGFCYLQIEQYDQAIQDISAYIALNSTSSYEAYPNRATGYFKTKNYQAALNDLALVEKETPVNMDYMLKGDCLVGLNRYDDAIEAYKHISQNPNPTVAAEGYFSIGETRKRQGDLTAAYEAFRQYTKVHPDNPRSYEQRAQCLLELHRYTDVINECSAYEKRFSDIGNIYSYHADALLSRNDPAPYRQLCQQVVARVGPTTDSITGNQAAWVCAIGPNGLKDYRVPLQLAIQAVNQTASLPETTPAQKETKITVLWANKNTYAALLYRAGKYEEAIQQLKQCEAMPRKFSPDDRFADHILLAMAYKSINRTVGRNYFRQAQELVPNPSTEQSLFLSEAKALLTL